MRQQHQHRKITPQYQEYQVEGDTSAEGGVEWEEFEVDNTTGNEDRSSRNAASPSRHDDGHKEEPGDRKKKKSSKSVSHIDI